jgi:hypothetical protein
MSVEAVDLKKTVGTQNRTGDWAYHVENSHHKSPADKGKGHGRIDVPTGNRAHCKRARQCQCQRRETAVKNELLLRLQRRSQRLLRLETAVPQTDPYKHWLW